MRWRYNLHKYYIYIRIHLFFFLRLTKMKGKSIKRPWAEKLGIVLKIFFLKNSEEKFSTYFLP